MDPTELLDQLAKTIRDNIDHMADALASGVCMNNSAPDRAYANCVGRVEAWRSTLEDINELRQKYIDE
jgi:hypothetical protein